LVGAIIYFYRKSGDSNPGNPSSGNLVDIENNAAFQEGFQRLSTNIFMPVVESSGNAFGQIANDFREDTGQILASFRDETVGELHSFATALGKETGLQKNNMEEKNEQILQNNQELIGGLFSRQDRNDTKIDELISSFKSTRVSNLDHISARTAYSESVNNIMILRSKLGALSGDNPNFSTIRDDLCTMCTTIYNILS